MKYVKFFGSAGYYGTEYEYIEAFSDDVLKVELDDISKGFANNNAEDYSYYVIGGGNEFESEEEEFYYENAVENCGWCYTTEKEWIDAGGFTNYLN